MQRESRFVCAAVIAGNGSEFAIHHILAPPISVTRIRPSSGKRTLRQTNPTLSTQALQL
jgi:hypothetical protein